ncbi:MAG: DHA2 family efflux MFS transporter permease subunit [Acidimicrobiales bacterium]
MDTGHERRWRILAVLSIAVFLVVVDNTVVNVALPTLARDLHASTASLQWIVDGYSLPFAGLLLAGGGLSDRLGRRGVMQAALIAFGVFSFLAAHATNVATLLTARALMGAAAAFIFPATLSLLTVAFRDPRERATAFGVWGAVAGVAIAVGPVLGGVLLVHYWVGSIFLINLPVVVVAVALTSMVVPESRAPQRRRFDLVGLALGTGAVTALVLAIIEGPSWGWMGTTTLALFAAAVSCAVSFVLVELRHAEPLLDVRVFRRPSFSAGAGAIAASYFCLFGFIFLITQYFQLVRGYSALSAGVHTLPFAAVAMVATPLGAQLALRVGTRQVVASGLATMSGSMVWVSRIGAHAAYAGPIVGSMMVMALGFSLINAPATAAIMATLSADQVGAGAAANETTRELGGTLGVAVIGSVFSSLFGPAVRSAFLRVGLNGAPLAAAQRSMQEARATVTHLPTAVQPGVAREVTAAFIDGLHRGCLVAAAATLGVALAVLATMPSRLAASPLDVPGAAVGDVANSAAG